MDFFPPLFPDDSTIVYRDSGNLNFIFPSTLISFFDLQQKKILKTVKTRGIMSPLFVIGPHLVFVR